MEEGFLMCVLLASFPLLAPMTIRFGGCELHVSSAPKDGMFRSQKPFCLCVSILERQASQHTGDLS